VFLVKSVQHLSENMQFPGFLFPQVVQDRVVTFLGHSVVSRLFGRAGPTHIVIPTSQRDYAGHP